MRSNEHTNKLYKASIVIASLAIVIAALSAFFIRDGTIGLPDSGSVEAAVKPSPRAAPVRTNDFESTDRMEHSELEAESPPPSDPGVNTNLPSAEPGAAPEASPPSAQVETSWGALYADYIKSQNFELKELRLHSDGEVFPVHTVNAETIAAYQAEFYTIPGIELPVMVLTEFYPHFSDPDALDTFPVPIAYVIRDGAVTWNLTPDESATIYDEREESQMIFINGELIKKFLLSGTSSREVEMRIDGLYEWLNAQ